MPAKLRPAIPTPQCAHGVDFPELRCDPCMDIASDERWVASERRQIDAGQFALDVQQRELERRTAALKAKKAARSKLRKSAAKVVTVSPGNQGSKGTTCVCGHAVEEHGHDDEHPGSTACSECSDCIAYESDRG